VSDGRQDRSHAELYVADPPFARCKEAWHDAGTYQTDAPRIMVAACLLGYGLMLDLRRVLRPR
jgi:hypothetical protein